MYSDEDDENLVDEIIIKNTNKIKFNIIQESIIHKEETNLIPFLDSEEDVIIDLTLGRGPNHKASTSKASSISTDQAKQFIQKTLHIALGTKRLIQCPFHNDSKPSALLYPAGGLKCMSSNCKYYNKYLTNKKFAELLANAVE